MSDWRDVYHEAVNDYYDDRVPEPDDRPTAAELELALDDREWRRAHAEYINAARDPLEHGDQGDAQGDTDVTEGTGLADEDTRVDLLAALTDGSWTVRQQRGFLAAAGVTGLPQQPTPPQIAEATEALTAEQADRVAPLMEQVLERGADRVPSSTAARPSPSRGQE